MHEDIAVEISRLTRVALERVRHRIAALQLGEAFTLVEQHDGDRRRPWHPRETTTRRAA